MSWSLPFNGKRSIIRDSYQRVAITIPINELASPEFHESVKELTLANLLHINVIIPSNSKSIINPIQSLKHVSGDISYAYRAPDSAFAQTSRTLFVSFQFHNDAFSLATELLTAGFDADLWILDVVGNKNKSLQNIHEMHRLISEKGKKTVLGIGNCEGPMELDWFCSKIRVGTIALVHLGDITLPNLNLHSIELVHTMGLTVMANVSHKAIETENTQSAQLVELAGKYSITPDVFLIKCLLQLGYVVSLPYSYYHPDHAERAASVARLSHPFVHRKQFVSMFRVISLSIAQEDLQTLISQSEIEEAKADVFWTPHATARSDNRTLTYEKETCYHCP